MRTLPTPQQRAAAVAARQDAAIGLAQARAAGLSYAQVRHLVDRGIWQRAVRGVFVIAGSPDTWRQRAWVAYLATCDTGGVLSHVTAGAVLGLLPASPLPHVTVPPGASARCPIAKIHRSGIDGRDLLWRDGLRLTSANRIVLDLAPCLAGDDFQAFVDDAMCKKLITRDSVLRCVERAGPWCAGAEVTSATVEAWASKIEPGSVAEMRLLRLLDRLHVEGIVLQHEVRTPEGQFVARIDLAQPHAKRGFEYDGELHHGPRAWPRDEPRYAALLALGWDIEPVTKVDLLPGDTRLRDIVERWHRRQAG